jgi:DNA mismatch endonuclease, patch repair protein
MVDFMTTTQRSRAMSKVSGKNTKPEIEIRSGLHRYGFRFRLNDKKLPGKPDIVLRKYSKIIFVHGCFWHHHESCSKSKMPQTRKEFWGNKIRNNVIRDQKNIEKLENMGWCVAIVWECATKTQKNLINTIDALNRWIKKGRSCIEIPEP